MDPYAEWAGPLFLLMTHLNPLEKIQAGCPSAQVTTWPKLATTPLERTGIEPGQHGLYPFARAVLKDGPSPVSRNIRNKALSFNQLRVKCMPRK